ncbi:hypothetical protein BLSTO_02405 [Blastocystis sp. subtype 1]
MLSKDSTDAFDAYEPTDTLQHANQSSEKMYVYEGAVFDNTVNHDDASFLPETSSDEEEGNVEDDYETLLTNYENEHISVSLASPSQVESHMKQTYEYLKMVIRNTSIQWEAILLVALCLLVCIVGIRTYLYDWAWSHNTLLTVVEVFLNLFIVIDYTRNIMDAPVKSYFITSIYGCFNFLAGLPVIVVTIVPKQYFLVYFFVVELRTFFFFLFLRNMKLWKEAFMERREREIMITVAELVLFVFSFGCLFTNTERSVVEYTLIDSLYFAFVTVTTVGYGDLSAQTQAGRFATTYYIVSILFWLPSKLTRLFSMPAKPKDHFTQERLVKRAQAEHVVIIGYFKEFLPLLISELKEGSSDYLQDTVFVLLTQESIDLGELQRMCGRFASHVQIIYGTPISSIS